MCRVLRGYDEKWFGQGTGFPLCRHLSFLHCFQQGALRLGRGAIDLVGQHHLGEDRSRMKMEGAALPVEDRNAKNIRRQKIRSELESFEPSVD